MPSTTKKNIGVVIVDDSPVVSMILEDVVRFAGFTTLARWDNGHDALHNIKASKPDLVLLDQHLPDTNGLILLKEIKSFSPSTTVIMITLECDPKVEKQAKLLGAASFIQKPFTADKVTHEMKQALSRTGRYHFA